MPSTDSDKSKPLTEVSLPLSFSTLAISHEGDPVSLQRKTISSLAPDELLVRVNYASINKMDPLFAKRNIFQLPAPYVLGFDFSGVVVKKGSEGPQGVQVGEPVFGGTAKGGCFAEYVVVKSPPGIRSPQRASARDGSQHLRDRISDGLREPDPIRGHPAPPRQVDLYRWRWWWPRTFWGPDGQDPWPQGHWFRRQTGDDRPSPPPPG